MKEWTIRDIAMWQEETFNPSVRSQKEKSDLEFIEYTKARGRSAKRKELIDWFISKCWLAYFKRNPDAVMGITLIQRLPEWKEIQKGINEKMAINLERNWIKTETGEWRHTND